tara:strand:+ start:2134 stop:2343 length:210 start_codon:yes stop_codon:yes gene_type:complete
MIESTQVLLAKKISLESSWNQTYLEEGRVTNAMQETSHKIKVIVKELIDRDMQAVTSNNKDLEVHLFAG